MWIRSVIVSKYKTCNEPREVLACTGNPDTEECKKFKRVVKKGGAEKSPSLRGCYVNFPEQSGQIKMRIGRIKARPQRIQDRSPNARRIQVEIAQAEGTPILQRLFGRLRTIPIGPNICRMQELPAGARDVVKP